jgi:Fungal specific transcription factor domain
VLPSGDYPVRYPRDIGGTNKQIRTLSGVALRQCVSLGYHRSLRRTKQDPLKAEMARRCFWVSYDMDRAAGVTLGRPFCIADKDIDIEVSSAFKVIMHVR